MVKNGLIFILCSIALNGIAQNMLYPNKSIDTIFINAKTYNYGKTNIHQLLDSTIMAQYATRSLADVLMQNGTANVKNYGPSNLAYMSIRGSSASQVAVLWNGVNINAASLGATDMFSEAHIQYGGNSLAWGSGDVGGSIHLNNKNNISKQSNLATIGGVLASFGNGQLQANILTHYGKLKTSTKIIWRKEANNFKYIDPTLPNNQYKLNTNGQFLQYGLMHESILEVSKNNIWEALIWLQNTKHNLPSSASQSNSEQWQQDWHIRCMLNNKFSKNNNILTSKLAYFKEYLRFQDSTINIDSRYVTHNFFADIEATKNIKTGLQLFTAITAQHIFMQTSEYTTAPFQTKFACRSGFVLKSKNEKWNLQAGARLENNNAQLSPLIYNTVAKYKVIPNLNVYASIGNNFRLPSFNDMYWKIGGNKNLKSEAGLTQEIGLQLGTTKKSLNIALYNRTINNWIIWLPNNNNIWTPSNIAIVNSKGIDVLSTYMLHLFKIPFQITGAYTYLNSKNKQANNAITFNKQLIYVPCEKATLSIMASKNNFNYYINAMYTGLQYTSSDNLNELPAYLVANFQINKQFQIKNINFNALIGVNNILNATYQTVAARPMPLRNYSLGLTTSIINKK
jgi:vitamin B12 transporter